MVQKELDYICHEESVMSVGTRDIRFGGLRGPFLPEVSFVGVGNMLTMLMRRGLLRSRDAAPVGSMEDSTVPVTEVEEDYDAPA